MTILQKIKDNNLTARKVKNKEITRVLTPLISETSIIGKNNGNRETTDAEAIVVLKKFIKNLKETIKVIIGEESFNLLSDEKLKLIHSAEKEIQLLEKFLPAQVQDSELEIIIKDYISAGANNIGAVMKLLKQNYLGLYDGKKALDMIKNQLA